MSTKDNIGLFYILYRSPNSNILSYFVKLNGHLYYHLLVKLYYYSDLIAKSLLSEIWNLFINIYNNLNNDLIFL